MVDKSMWPLQRNKARKMITSLVPSFFSTILVAWRGKLSLLKDCQLGWIGELAWTYLNLFLLLSFPPLCMASILFSNIHFGHSMSVTVHWLFFTNQLFQKYFEASFLSFLSWHLVLSSLLWEGRSHVFRRIPWRTCCRPLLFLRRF